jgi:inner membrane protein YidH
MSGGPYDPERPVDPRDYTRRTLLANERTYLAWWRTGITSLAAGLGAARVAPALANAKHDWPYTVLGAGFAVIGLVCFAYGHLRRVHVDRSVREGDFAELSHTVTLVISVGGVLLAAGLVVLIIAEG